MGKKLSEVYKSNKNRKGEAAKGNVRPTLKQILSNYEKYVKVPKE
jgi:hypothetical protein